MSGQPPSQSATDDRPFATEPGDDLAQVLPEVQNARRARETAVVDLIVQQAERELLLQKIGDLAITAPGGVRLVFVAGSCGAILPAPRRPVVEEDQTTV